MKNLLIAASMIGVPICLIAGKGDLGTSYTLPELSQQVPQPSWAPQGWPPVAHKPYTEGRVICSSCNQALDPKKTQFAWCLTCDFDLCYGCARNHLRNAPDDMQCMIHFTPEHPEGRRLFRPTVHTFLDSSGNTIRVHTDQYGEESTLCIPAEKNRHKNRVQPP